MTISTSGSPVLAHNTGGTTPVTLTSPTMANGRLLVVWAATYSIDTGAGAVSDPVVSGGAWTKVDSQITGGGGVYLSAWWKLCNTLDALAGTTTISVDPDPGGGGFDFITVACRAYDSTTGFPVNPVDGSAAKASSTGANPTSPAITTTAAGTVVMAGWTDAVSDAAYTPPGGAWGVVSNDFGQNAYNALVVLEQIFASTQSSLTVTVTRASATFAKMAIAFKENSGGGTTPTGSDTGTLGDRVTGIALDGQRETGTTTDRVVGVALDGQRETATLSEVAVVEVSTAKTGVDTGTLADDVTDIQIDDGPEGVLTERVSGIALSGPTETGTAVERATLSVTLQDRDGAILGEASQITQTGTNPTDTDTGTLQDAGVLVVAVTASDGAAMVERASPGAAVMGSEASGMADAIAALLASLSTADTATLTDTQSVSFGAGPIGVLTGRVAIVPAVAGTVSFAPLT